MKLYDLNGQQLITKYGMDQPPQINNTIDKAIQAVERTVCRAVGRLGDTSPLFNPDWNPDMWELDNETMQYIRRKFGDFIAGVSDGSVFLYLTGQPELRAYGSDIERLAYMLSYTGQNGCDIRLAPGACTKGTVFLPHARGQFLLVYEICGACEAWVRETTETNYKLSLMAAYESP